MWKDCHQTWQFSLQKSNFEVFLRVEVYGINTKAKIKFYRYFTRLNIVVKTVKKEIPNIATTSTVKTMKFWNCCLPAPPHGKAVIYNSLSRQRII